MAKAKKKHTNRTHNILIVVIAVMAAVIVGLLLMQGKAQRDNDYEIRTSLGPMEYRLEDGTAVQRTDDAATQLRNFLKSEAKNDGCNADSSYQVMAASEDETQVLLRYGCGTASARMFAVLLEGTWQTISPTNQFDILGTPRCEHVDEHNIDTSIAPVCVNGHGEGPLDEHEYIVR